MAGSYHHICNADGSFRMDLIENMGDAHEALEACHGIIERQREALGKLARLGNEPEYGNSIGNQIARAALPTPEPGEEEE